MTLNSKQRTLMLALAALTFLSIFFLTLCLVLFLEPDEGYFAVGKGVPLRVAFAAAYLLGLVLCVLCGILTPRTEVLQTENTVSGPHKLRFTLAGTLTVLLGALEILLNLEHSVEISLIVGVGACLYGLYMLLVGAHSGLEARIPTVLCLYLGACMPLGISLGNTSNYYRHINSVENDLSTVFCISFMIYILYEGNRLTSGTHSRFHLSAMLATLHSGTSLAVAYILAYLSGTANETSRLYQMLLVLAVCIAVAVELARYLSINPPHPDPEDADAKESEEERIVQNNDIFSDIRNNEQETLGQFTEIDYDGDHKDQSQQKSS